MISSHLEKLFLLSLVLIYLHGIEEILTGFQYTDSFMIFFANYFNTTPATFYWISHIVWWITLPLLFVVFQKHSFILALMTFFSFVFIVEIHHLVKGLLAMRYYPGIITAFFYPVVGVLFWKQLVKEWREKN